MTLFWKSEAENETECIRQFPTQKLSFFLLRKKKKTSGRDCIFAGNDILEKTCLKIIQ